MEDNVLSVTTIPFMYTNQNLFFLNIFTIPVWKIMKYFQNGFAVSALFWYSPGNNCYHRFRSSAQKGNHWQKLKIWTLTSRKLNFSGLLSIGLILLEASRSPSNTGQCLQQSCLLDKTFRVNGILNSPPPHYSQKQKAHCGINANGQLRIFEGWCTYLTTDLWTLICKPLTGMHNPRCKVKLTSFKLFKRIISTQVFCYTCKLSATDHPSLRV